MKNRLNSFALSLLICVTFGYNPRTRWIKSASGTKPFVLVVVHGDMDDVDILQRPEIFQLRGQYFAYEDLALSFSYDRAADRAAWAECCMNVSYDFYLTHRTGAFSKRDVSIIKAFDVARTPMFFIASRSGEILGTYSGVDYRVDENAFVEQFRAFLLQHARAAE